MLQVGILVVLAEQLPKSVPGNRDGASLSKVLKKRGRRKKVVLEMVPPSCLPPSLHCQGLSSDTNNLYSFDSIIKLNLFGHLFPRL